MSCAIVAAGVAAVGVGASIYSSNKASNAQTAAANQANATQTSEFDQQQATQAPYLGAGYGALAQMQDPYYQEKFGMGQFQQDPAYQFNLQQGMSALQNSAAARGGLMSGNTLAGISQYSQGQANNEYQQAFNNFNTTQSNSYGRLATLAGLGEGVAENQGALGANMANQIGQNTMGAANAQGAAAIAQGNAWGTAASGLGNYASTQSILNKLNTPNYVYPNGYPSAGGSNLTTPQIGSSEYGGGGSLSQLGNNYNFSAPSPYTD